MRHTGGLVHHTSHSKLSQPSFHCFVFWGVLGGAVLLQGCHKGCKCLPTWLLASMLASGCSP